MKSVVIFLFILSASSVAGSIYFQQIGILNPSPSYGHVHFMIDTPIIMTQLQKHHFDDERAGTRLRPCAPSGQEQSPGPTPIQQCADPNVRYPGRAIGTRHHNPGSGHRGSTHYSQTIRT